MLKSLGYIFISFALVFQSAPPPGSRNAKKDIDTLKNRTDINSTHQYRFLAKELKSHATDKSYREAVKVNQADLTKQLHQIVDAYDKKKNEYDARITALEISGDVAKGAIAIGAVFAPETAGASLIFSGLGYLADKGFSEVEEAYKEAAKVEIRRNLKTSLNQIAKRDGNSEVNRIKSIKDVKKFRERLEAKSSLFGGALDDIPAEDKDLVLGFYDTQLADMMADGFKSLADVSVIQVDKIEENRKAITSLTKSFGKFAEKTGRQIKDIQQKQQSIVDGLNSLKDQIGHTQAGVDFIKDYLYSKMSPEEQLAALKAGHGPNLPPEEEKIYQAKLELVNNRIKLLNTASDFMNGAQTLVNIAGKAGLDPKLLGKVQEGLNIGHTAVSAFAALASGNYLGCINAVASLFGGSGGRDIAGERHEELKSMLMGVYSKLDGIDQKVDQLLQGQKDIIQNQKVILEAVVELAKAVQANQQQLMDKLREIDQNVLYNRKLIVTLASKDYGGCRNMIFDQQDPNNHKRVINTSLNQLPSYDKFAELFRDFRENCLDCMKILQKPRTLTQEFDPYFFLESYKTPGEGGENPKISTYINDVYKPAWEVLSRSYPFYQKTIEAKVTSLFTPMKDVQSLVSKTKDIQELSSDPTRTRFKQSFPVLMASLLSPEIVDVHANYALDYHFYYPLLNTNDQAYTFRELLALKNEQIRKTGYYVLLESLTMIDIVIAQQNMLSGDVLLPIISDIHEAQRDRSTNEIKEWYERAQDALRNNQILSRNFLLYQLRKEVLSKSNFFNYAAALGFTDKRLLTNSTITSWDFQYSDSERDENGKKKPKGWSILLNGNYFPLPSAEELKAGQLLHQSEVNNFLELRSRTIDQINSYAIFDNIKGPERLKLNLLMMNNL